jgi:hypothetical protein
LKIELTDGLGDHQWSTMHVPCMWSIMQVVHHAWSSKIPQDSPRFPKIPLSDLYAEPSGGPGPPGPPLFFVFVSPPPPAPSRLLDPPLTERSKTLGRGSATWMKQGRRRLVRAWQRSWCAVSCPGEQRPENRRHLGHQAERWLRALASPSVVAECRNWGGW